MNIGAIPESLAKAELEGAKRGSYSDCLRDRVGALSLAANGTVFLDEIDKANPHSLAVLLRFLGDGEITALGDPRPVKVNARVIAASCLPLDSLVESGSLPPDIRGRLNVGIVVLPSLKECPEDIVPLARRFIPADSREDADPRALVRLLDFDFKDGVRELKNIVQSACVVGLGKFTLKALEMCLAARAVQSPDSAFAEPSLEEYDRRLVLKCLVLHGGDVVAAADTYARNFARKKSMSPQGFRKKLLAYRIPPGYGSSEKL